MDIKPVAKLLISAKKPKVVDNGLHGENVIESGCRLARGSPHKGLRAQARRLESTGDSPSFGRYRGGGKPVDEARA
jgi:hypothetical protein